MSKKIKIKSNPYKQEIKYYDFNDITNEWEEIMKNNPNSKLRETESEKSFFPFKVNDIVDIILEEYYVKNSKIEIVFEGNYDEYEELKKICSEDKNAEKIILKKEPRTLENARIIIPKIKNSFDNVELLIKEIIKDDTENLKSLNKVSDTLKDIIPICVFGNYSCGKSTFINALIGYEILPSGGDPVTAKVYKITRSKDIDVARVKFDFDNTTYELLFEGNKYRVLIGDKDNILLTNIQKAIDEQEETSTMQSLVYITLQHINNYEKENKSHSQIGNVIEVELPFSKEGVLGQSYNNFVIFDTPGSNSETNTEHKKVLEEALDGFSNGIPVWVSTYETIDSTDNASLCDKINDIKALDKRFTMIVLNKADGSDLTSEQFDDKKKEEILSFNSIDKMYASGIYFVSSIMGLGSKNNGVLIDKHYRKIYRSQQEMYINPNDEDYVTLYKYNIMPEQIKQNAIAYSLENPNLIYANSGLYCVEKEIEQFASRYASYNKCQMVYSFLKDIIKETNLKIDTKTSNLSSANSARKKELEIEKQQLISSINKKSEELKNGYIKDSLTFVKDYLDKNIHYSHTIEEIESKKQEMDKTHGIENKIDIQKSEVEKAKTEMLNNLNFKNIFKGAKNYFEKSQKAINEFTNKKKEITVVEDRIDSRTADGLVKIINEDYKNNAIEITNKLLNVIKDMWKDHTKNLKELLIMLVVGDSSLSQEQKDELSNLIIHFEIEKIDENVDSIFKKSDYLDGMIFGFKIFSSEEISVRKLTNSYNSEIKKLAEKLANRINENCKEIFIEWENSLEILILNNLTEFSPSLREKTNMINEDNEKIKELKNSQRKIEASIEVIEELMSWKNIE